MEAKDVRFKIPVLIKNSIDSTGITLNPDPDPNWAKLLDPDPNSMYLDPQH